MAKQFDSGIDLGAWGSGDYGDNREDILSCPPPRAKLLAEKGSRERGQIQVGHDDPLLTPDPVGGDIKP